MSMFSFKCPEISIFSKLKFQDNIPPKNRVAISIRNYCDVGANQKLEMACSRYHKCLKITFDEVTPQLRDCLEAKGMIMFSEDHMRQIFFFLEKAFLDVPPPFFLDIHCEAGVCRSPAIAAGILFWFNEYEKFIKFFKENTALNSFVLYQMIRFADILNNGTEEY